MHHMSRFVKTFEERYPEASVRLEYLHPARVVERVTGGEADLGLISYPRKLPELTVIPWREEVMVLAVHPSHRFAQRPAVDIRELDGEAFVAFDGNLSIRRAIDRCLHHYDVNVEVVLQFDNVENIKRAVEIPAGVSILPEPSLARELRAGSLIAVRIDGQDAKYRLNRPLAIIHRRHDNLDLTAARFLELLTGSELQNPISDPPESSRRVPVASSS
jgi:DNA-binding transcriptional LysR family regulator